MINTIDRELKMKNNKKKICIVTGSRSDYGLLHWIINYIAQDSDLELQLIATGMHLSKEFGETYKVIESDGFTISEKIDVLLSSDSPSSIAKSTGIAVMNFASTFEREKPDVLLILGDRFEIFAAALSASILNIPIAHIHGGEITEGAIDEVFRHSITKMSNFHFVAAEEYRKRVIQLGENPNHVFNFGSPGLDNLQKLSFISKSELENQLGLKFGKINFLITYHPVTLYSKEKNELAIENLLKALNNFPEAHFYFTGSNADSFGKHMNKKIIDYIRNNTSRAIFHISLGQLKYISLLKVVDVIIGNSSSGLIEAAALKIPTINIGPRQDGRLKSSSVIDCAEDKNEIIYSIKKALSSSFKETLSQGYFPYGFGENNSCKIYNKIKEIKFDSIFFKKFHDII